MDLLLFEPIKEIHHLRSRLLLYYPLLADDNDNITALTEADQYLQLAARLWLLDLVHRVVEYMRSIGIEAELIENSGELKSSDDDIRFAFSHYLERCLEKMQAIPNEPRFLGIKAEITNLAEINSKFQDYIQNSEEYISAMTESFWSSTPSPQEKNTLH